MKPQKGYVAMTYWQLLLLVTSIVFAGMGMAFATADANSGGTADIVLASVGVAGLLIWTSWCILDEFKLKAKQPNDVK
jgi:hypothetical protein